MTYNIRYMVHNDIDTYVVIPNYEEKFFADKTLLKENSQRVYRNNHFYMETEQLYSMLDKNGKTQTFKVTITKLIG